MLKRKRRIASTTPVRFPILLLHPLHSTPGIQAMNTDNCREQRGAFREAFAVELVESVLAVASQ